MYLVEVRKNKEVKLFKFVDREQVDGFLSRSKAKIDKEGLEIVMSGGEVVAIYEANDVTISSFVNLKKN
jgi:hypothetical protein